jgi:hypothetical protein
MKQETPALLYSTNKIKEEDDECSLSDDPLTPPDMTLEQQDENPPELEILHNSIFDHQPIRPKTSDMNGNNRLNIRN